MSSRPWPRPSLRVELTPVVHLARPHIVAIAALGALTFGRFLTGALLFPVAALAALDWFLVNFVNRAVDLPEDRANRVPGIGFMALHRQLIARGSLVALAASLVATHLAMPALTPWRLAYHLLGLAYNYPLFGRRLKQLYGVKNIASATGFLLTSFAYPLAVAGARLERPAVLALAAFFFLFELSYEVIYDLRDADGDRRNGVPTLPARHGGPVAARIVDLLAVASIGVLAGSWAAGRLAWGHAVLFVAPALQMRLLRVWTARGGPTGEDCVRLTWLGALLLGTYQAWLALGLPGSGGI